MLQEMYLHLERPAQISAVRSRKHYLLMIATNIARMSFRRSRRWGIYIGTRCCAGLVDENSNPLVRLEALQDVGPLKLVFVELSERRQSIFIASRVEGGVSAISQRN